MTEDGLLDRIARLEASEAVRHLIAAYADACDAVDVERLGRLFADDAVLRNPDARRGRHAIVEYYETVLNSLSFRRHHVTNVAITVADASHASYAASFLAALGREGDSVLTFGSYRDTVERQDRGWVFTEKVNEIVSVTTLEDGWGG